MSITSIMRMMDSEEGDKEFVEQLFIEMEEPMLKMACKVVKDYAIAQDIVSEMCIDMLRNVQYLRAMDKCKQIPYILFMVKKKSLMYLRRRKTEWNLLEKNRRLFEVQILEDVDSRLIAEADMQMLYRALSRIHKKDSELLKMKYFENLTDKAIAQRIGIKTSSVRFYLTKARRSLKIELKKEDNK